MNVFEVRDRLVREYAAYVRNFIQIRDERIAAEVDRQLDGGLLWPDPLLQLNPSFQPGAWIDDLAGDGTLHRECARVFRRDKSPGSVADAGRPMRLYRCRSSGRSGGRPS